MRMHIVFVINLGGGPEAFIKNLLPSFKEHNIKVSIILNTLPKGSAHAFPGEVKTFPLISGSLIPYYTSKVFTLLNLPQTLAAKWVRKSEEKRLIKTLKIIEQDTPIDLVEVTEGVFVGRISKKWKVVTRAHGSAWSFRMFCKDENNSLDSYFKKWQRRQHLNSRANFAISRHTRDHLTEQCHLTQGLIQYIPYPIPLEQFQTAVPKKTDQIPEDSPLILSIGRLEHRKGMDILVRSMNKVWEKIPNAYLMILGKAAQFSIDELKQLVPESNRSQIIYPGFVHYRDIPSFYKSADVYVSASQYETFGYTLLEAMAAGCPVVCTDRGAMPELIKDNVNGIVVPFGETYNLANAIITILSSVELRQNFILNNEVKAKEYDLENLGTKIINSYLSLC